MHDHFWKTIPAWQDVDEETFSSAQWQEKNAVTNTVALKRTLGDLVSLRFYEDVDCGIAKAPMAVRLSPYIIGLINWHGAASDPLRRQFLPLGTELEDDHPALAFDSLDEQTDSPVPGLIHRYKNRVLMLAVDTCPVYCRFCTRSYAVGNDVATLNKSKFPVNRTRWDAALDYIRNTPSIEDVVISGGDAFRLKPSQITYIGESLLDIPHVRRFRFATKGLSVQPTKIVVDVEWTNALVDIAKQARRTRREVSVQTHFNHPREVTKYTAQAMKILYDNNVHVRNQTVLQRFVNDTNETMSELIAQLIRINIEPYYVYVCDLVTGIENLRTSLRVAIDLEKSIRGNFAGFNTPTWVVDLPGGGGKRDIHSFEYYDEDTGVAVFRSPSVKPGRDFLYFDPLHSLGEGARRLWGDAEATAKIVWAASNGTPFERPSGIASMAAQ